MKNIWKLSTSDLSLSQNFISSDIIAYEKTTYCFVCRVVDIISRDMLDWATLHTRCWMDRDGSLFSSHMVPAENLYASAE